MSSRIQNGAFAPLKIYGNLTLTSGYSANNGEINFSFSFLASGTITSAGKKIVGNWDFGASGITVQLGDDCNFTGGGGVGGFANYTNTGTLTLNDHNYTGLLTNDVAGCTFTLGTGTNNFHYQFRVQAGDTVTSSSTLTLNLVSYFNAIDFSGGGFTWGTINYGATSTAYLSNSSTIGTLSFNGTIASIVFENGSTTTITSNMTLTSTVGTTLQSQTGGTAWNLVKTSGAITISGVTLKDSHASGGATFTAVNSLDGGGNTGWNIAAPVKFIDEHFIQPFRRLRRIAY